MFRDDLWAGQEGAADRVHRSWCAAGQEHRGAGAGLCGAGRYRKVSRHGSVVNLRDSDRCHCPTSLDRSAAVPEHVGDPEQEYFADGMVEDIITALSRFKACSSSRAIPRSPTKARLSISSRSVASLASGTCLKAACAKSASACAITGQLIEARAGTHIWADRFDGALEDVFDFRTEVEQGCRRSRAKAPAGGDREGKAEAAREPGGVRLSICGHGVAVGAVLEAICALRL